MATIVPFRDLDAWRLAMDLAVVAHDIAARLPQIERYELSAQVRRASTSIPSNVAEGHAREPKTFRHHVRIAIGSLAELDTQVELVHRCRYLEEAVLGEVTLQIQRVGKVLHGLERSLLRRQLRSSALVVFGFVAVAVTLRWITG